MLDQRFTRSAEVKEKKENLLFSITLSSTLWELCNLLGVRVEGGHEGVAGLGLNNKFRNGSAQGFLTLPAGSAGRPASRACPAPPGEPLSGPPAGEAQARVLRPPPLPPRSQEGHGRSV